MKKKELVYYNTLLMCFTDGRTVWNDTHSSAGYVPPGRSDVRFKINGKTVPRSKVMNGRYLVKILPPVERDLPDWCY